MTQQTLPLSEILIDTPGFTGRELLGILDQLTSEIEYYPIKSLIVNGIPIGDVETFVFRTSNEKLELVFLKLSGRKYSTVCHANIVPDIELVEEPHFDDLLFSVELNKGKLTLNSSQANLAKGDNVEILFDMTRTVKLPEDD